MLAVFEKSIGKPPEELKLSIPYSIELGKSLKSRDEIAEVFRWSWPNSSFYQLYDGNFMALTHMDENPLLPRSVVIADDIFCIFVGNLENICELRRHYGLSRQTKDAILVIEVYKVLRDRAPYPCDRVIRDLVGKFAFILFDAKCGTLFTARDREGGVKFQWGVAGDGSLVFSDDPKIILEACGRSYAPFPTGCIFTNGSGLVSFDHPLNKVRAILREDKEGVIFKVDLYTRVPSIPHTGSSANWADTTMVEAE